MDSSKKVIPGIRYIRDAPESSIGSKGEIASQSQRARQGFRPICRGPLPAIASGHASDMTKLTVDWRPLDCPVVERAYPRSLPANNLAKDNSLEIA